jgi:hypothetical protein
MLEFDVKEIDVEDIPVIAFAGSGGGFRAIISNTGNYKIQSYSRFIR